MLKEVPDEIIGEIAGWLPVGDMVRFSSACRRFRHSTTHVLFKTVCLCPRPGGKKKVPRNHPSPLPSREALKVQQLICDGTEGPLCHFNVDLALRAILEFSNLKGLIVEDSMYGDSGVDTILERIGALPTNPFPNLRYLEIVSVCPTTLQHHMGLLHHLCIRKIPARGEQSTGKFLANSYPNLTMLTLDCRSLTGLLMWEDGRRLCGGVEKMRIVWDLSHLMDWDWYIEKRARVVRLPGVRHLHMDVGRDPFWGDVGDVKVALRNMLRICGEIGGTQLTELVIFVSEEALHNEDDYFELASRLPRTFRCPASLDQLSGVAVFFEVRDETAVKEFRRGFGSDTDRSLKVLQRDPDDITETNRTMVVVGETNHTLWSTALAVTEGAPFRCSCSRREMTQRRYVNHFLDNVWG